MSQRQVEVRSIDYVPLNVRHGKLSHLGPLWFMGNAQGAGDADLSMFVGLPVSGILYLVLARSIDVEAETRIAQSEAERVERFAREHQLPAEAL